jgi:hypothetical protein
LVRWGTAVQITREIEGNLDKRPVRLVKNNLIGFLVTSRGRIRHMTEWNYVKITTKQIVGIMKYKALLLALIAVIVVSVIVSILYNQQILLIRNKIIIGPNDF